MSVASTGASVRYAVRGIASRGISIAAAFAMTWIILKSLPTTMGGRFVAAYAVLIGLATVARMGMDNLLLKQTAADAQLARPYLRVVSLSVLAFSTVAALVLFVLVLLYFPGVPWWALALLGSTVVPLNLALLAGSVLRGLGQVTAGSIAELGSLPGITFALIVGVRLLHLHVGLTVVSLAFTAGAYATAAWSLPLAVGALHRASRPGPAEGFGPFWRTHGTSLRQFMITAVGYYLFTNVPVIVLFGYPAQAAHFTAARTLANLVGTVPTIQIAYLSPLFANLFHHGKLDELNRLIRRQTLAGTAVAAVLSLPLLVIPHWVMHIYKPEYAEASLTLQILAAAVLLQVMLGPVQGLLVTCGFEREAARTTLVMLIGGTVLMLLVVRWGAPAVAAVNAVANLAFMTVGALLLRRRERIVSPLGPSTRTSPPQAPRA